MNIEGVFRQDIFRSINGVVKAEQLDSASIRQELEEFVVTRELRGYLDRFFSAYLESVNNPRNADITGRIGVWVSGFFGSGKSHFIKVLNYLFRNQAVEIDGISRRAVEFFDGKIDDAMLLGNIKRAVSGKADVILFNIDSKADQSKGRDAILSVFLKVLNELQGYSPDHPHIAHMERYLDGQGKLGAFEDGYRSLTDEEWRKGRLHWAFNQDEIVEALSGTLGQSREACHRWIDYAETGFSLTVENFSKWTKEYLDTKGSDHRIFFFVDEVGQFIGQDGHLMLNLQTITENLGVVCEGRAWLIVTSQEDIDTVIGSVDNVRRNDFSKITGRFKTRFSLSGSNTDEVIQKRLLLKKEGAIDELRGLYDKNADILRNQITFSQDTGMTLLPYQSAEDFIKNYPFIPYQFKLLQEVFDRIRRAGATGLHLSRGERSMLDAFQYAGQKAAKQETGVLVPLYWFYPSIESFLDTSVKRTIQQAEDDPTLDKFDTSIIQTLFMIRYIEELKGNIDNLVTLCIDRIDADRLAIRKRIEGSLQRLERVTLISQSGDNYYFLTDEEQKIKREIDNTDLEFGAESRHLGKVIFDEIYRGEKRHRYSKTSKDFDINFLCDMQPLSGSPGKGLSASVISPFNEEYGMYGQSRCLSESTGNNGQVIVRLPENGKLSDELRLYLKTDRYIGRKNDGNPEVRRILGDRKNENTERGKRITGLVRDMLTDSDYYIAGQRFSPGSGDPFTAYFRSLDYLVDNTFPRMGYIQHPCRNPQAEIPAVLKRDDLSSFNLNDPESNPRAVSEVREYISLCAMGSTQMVFGDMVRERYGNRPWGWNEWETALILAKLYVAGEITFLLNGGDVERERVADVITKPSNWGKITIRQRKAPDPLKVENARKIGQSLFSEMGPDKEEPLTDFLRGHFRGWNSDLNQYKTIASTGSYPGRDTITEGLSLCAIMLDAKDSYTFISRINEHKDQLLGFAEGYHDVSNFYSSQRPAWDRLRNAKSRFDINKFELEKDESARSALIRMAEILEDPKPYGIIMEAEGLIGAVDNFNEGLLNSERAWLSGHVDRLVADFKNEAELRKCPEDISARSIKTLEGYKEKASNEHSIANIRLLKENAGEKLNELIGKIPVVDPEIKEIVTVRPASLSRKIYLETEQDVDVFVETIKNELKRVINERKRIKLE